MRVTHMVTCTVCGTRGLLTRYDVLAGSCHVCFPRYERAWLREAFKTISQLERVLELDAAAVESHSMGLGFFWPSAQIFA